MSQQIQELIDKIKSEGVQAAESQAQDIETQAKQKADEIIAQAKKEADQMIVSAKEEIQKLQDSTNMALRQSSRDMMLALRKEIESLLQGIIGKQVGDSLSSDNLSGVIGQVVGKYLENPNEAVDIQVAVAADDLEKLSGGVIADLQNKVKGNIVVKSSEDIGKGFTISFDGGKSSFDFSDKSLAEFLGAYLNAQVAEIVKESV